MKNGFSENPNMYANLGITGTGYLGFKVIPDLIKKYVIGKNTLDFGCGTGRSSRFLESIGLKVTGVDINQDMLNEAVTLDPNGSYELIKEGRIPSEDQSYDLILSSMVLFTIATKTELTKVFNEIRRVLKNNGVFIAITGSTELFNHKWLSLFIDYPENINLKSGDLGKIRLNDINLEVYNYFWTDDDYRTCITNAKLKLIDTMWPLGDDTDGFPWLSEKKVAPYVVYVIKKAEE